MFSVDAAPRYLAEASAGAARLQEQASPEQYAALVERATRLVDGMFTVDVAVDPELQVKIALREKFDPARVKQAILMVATWQLVASFGVSWNVRRAPAKVAAPAALVSAR